MLKKIISAALALVFILSVCCACGEKSKNAFDGEWTYGEGETPKGLLLQNDSFDCVPLGVPEKPLSAEKIFSGATLIPEIFNGYYTVEGGDDAVEEYKKNTPYIDFEVSAAEQITAVPYALKAGRRTCREVYGVTDEYTWIQLMFYTDLGFSVTLNSKYEIKDGKLVATPSKGYETDAETGKVTVDFYDYTFEYGFEFKGTEVVLSDGKCSVTLKAGLEEGLQNLYNTTYIAEGSDMFDGRIDYLSLNYDISSSHLTVTSDSGETVYNCTGVLGDDSLFTFTVPWEDGTKTYQCVYFYCAGDGFILFDGYDYYFYTQTKEGRYIQKTSNYVSPEKYNELLKCSELKLSTLYDMKRSLISKVTAKLEEKGVDSYTVDSANGEIYFDSEDFFEGSSSVSLSKKGGDIIDAFVLGCAEIANSEEADAKIIEKCVIDIHTDDGHKSSCDARSEAVRRHCSFIKGGKYTGDIVINSVGDAEPAEGAENRVSMRLYLSLDFEVKSQADQIASGAGN